MKQTARIWIRIWIAAAVASTAFIIYTAITGNEPLLAVGMVVLVISALSIPIMVKRACIQRKLNAEEGFLADWEYSPDEAEAIAAHTPWGKRAILRLPCRTRIGRNCLLIANRYHPLNDYGRMSAERAKFLPASDGMALLRVKYSFWAGKYRYARHEKFIDIPVPSGREAEAVALAETLGN